jgi:alpha-tubulin suppressor-like RCC1 family protein
MIKKIPIPMLILGTIFIVLVIFTISNLTLSNQGAILTGAKYVSAGGGFTCAVTTAGSVKCWGMNDSGQLGDGTTTYRTTPTDTLRLSGGIKSISTGRDHACALTETDAVKCWGANRSGQLGNGTTADQTVPVDVVGLDGGIAAIAAGDGHTCALTTDGKIKCWGSDTYGLGYGSTKDHLTPVDIRLDEPAQSITVNYMGACALLTNGSVVCWGNNSFSSQSAKPAQSDRSIPIKILSSNVKAIAAGGTYNCALTKAGAVKCWGNYRAGECCSDDGTSVDCATPWQVNGLVQKVTAMAVGSGHRCFLIEGGSIECTGKNGSGQLGDGTTTSRGQPVFVLGLSSGAVQVTVGESHTCALTTAGEVKCWGYNSYGRLGDGTNINRSRP